MFKKFIESVREEKNGFKFDKPWRVEEKSLGVIVPVLRKSRGKRNYITLAEAEELKIEDTGQIDYVFVTNNGKKPVLISRGDMFRGKTQERAAIHDHIVMPGKSLRVAVRCIHASKGIRTGTDMEYGSRTPYSVGFESQSRTWSGVSAYTTVLNAFENANTMRVTPTSSSTGPTGTICRTEWGAQSDDLARLLDDLSGAIKTAMKKIPYIENQVGAIFFHENKMIGMDVYDLQESWDAVKKDVVEKEGASFIKKDKDSEMFEFKPSKSKVLIKKCLSEKFEEKTIFQDGYKVVELKGEKLIGEAIEFKGKVIHLTFWSYN